MKRPYLIPLTVLCCAGIAYAAGSISVTGYPAVPRTLKGGTGINIAPDGTFTATGDAVATGAQPFANLSGALRGKYLPVAGTAVNAANAQAYKGNSAPSATEFSYLQGVTSAIQGQLDGKAATSSIALVGTTGQYSDLSGKPTIPSALSELSGDTTHRTVTDAEKSGWSAKQAALGYTAENAANKGSANGYPSLDSGGKVPSAQIPTLNQNTTGTAAGLTAQYIDWSFTSGGASIKNKPNLSTVATSGNYSDLNGKPAPYTLPTASTIVKGGVMVDGSSIQIDGGGVIHSTVSAGVSSVNGYTGDIDLQTTDILGFGNYSSSVKSRLAGKMDNVNPTYTGDLTTTNADNTHYSYDYNSASCPSGVDEGTKCTLPSGIWWYKSGVWTQAGLLPAYTLPTASANTLGGAKVGPHLSIDGNGVLDVMINSLGPSGLIVAGLSGDATIRKGFAYVAASSGKWTFANYSSGTTTLFSNYSGTVCAATSGGLNITNPVTFANRTSSCAKVYAGTYATIQSKGDGKYWVTSNRNLTKQGGAASGGGGGGGGGGFEAGFNFWPASNTGTLQPNETYVTTADSYPVTRTPSGQSSGVTFGWTSALFDTRTTGQIPNELKGYALATAATTFQVTGIPSGTYSLWLASGENDNARTQDIKIYDGSTLRATIGGATNAYYFIDASGAIGDASGWTATSIGTPITISITSGTFKAVIGTTGATDLNHIRIKQQ